MKICQSLLDFAVVVVVVGLILAVGLVHWRRVVMEIFNGEQHCLWPDVQTRTG